MDRAIRPKMNAFYLGCLALLLFICNIEGVVGQGYRGHPTDTLTSAGENTRSGYMPNHNLDPNVLRSGTFDVIWRKKLLGNYKGMTEQIYAQPLVFTPKGGNQSVYVVSQQNIAYILDGKTGEILVHRQLMIPFLVNPDLEGCQDISDSVGSTATGVIDPATGTWYLTTKTYENQNNFEPQGLLKGRYWIHALDTTTLESKPGFPVPLEGLEADNAPWRVFEGGKHHQRPALMQVNQYIYAGFASHCVQWNFTGWIIGWNAQTGDIVAKYAMEGGKEKSGIGGGIWMSGGGLASDNPGRMFFATGNGYASQLADDPVPGRQPPTSLEEAVVNMVINEDGSVVPVDFFIPWEKRDLDAMDKDLGTSGFVLLDPNTFSTESVKKIGCVAGKMGKLYFLDLEDLGGYQMGPDRKDKVLQSIQLSAPVFASAGSYPLEGGYVYLSPVGKQTVALKFGRSPDGKPIFTQAGVTEHSAAGRQGVGHGTVTSLNGEPGSGILWLVDVEGTNVRAYGAVPENGILPTLLMLNNPGQSKFSRPAFGDGRVYLTSTTGFVTALGSPVNMPFTCSSPFDAGIALVGGETVTPINCTSKIALTVNAIDVDIPTHFTLGGLPNFPLQFAQGQVLSFLVKFQPKVVGPLSTTINIRTTNSGATPYAINTPVVIRGVARSVNPILTIQPNVVSFGEVITGTDNTEVQDFALDNGGESPLIIQSYKWSTVHPDGPYMDTPPTPDAQGAYKVGPFKFIGLPGVGSSIPGNSGSVTSVEFSPTGDGYYKVYIMIQSNGGVPKEVGVFGTAGSAPVAVLEWKNGDGEWIPYVKDKAFVFDGGVYLGAQATRELRLTNKGGTTLTTMISKPPVSGFVAALNGLGSIAEGSQLAPNKSEIATIICAPPKSQVNKDPQPLSAVWTFNFDDPTFGKTTLQFNCSGLSYQVGPKMPDGDARYRYLGCYKDANPDRQLPELLHYSEQNDNGLCATACQAKKNYIFAATEYEGECWCGNIVPKQKVADSFCQYLCKGNFTQYCGGDGAYMSLFADAERFDPDAPISSTTTSVSTSTTETGTVTVPPTNTVTSTTGTATTTTSSVPTTRPNYAYLGCANEGTNGRALAKDSYAVGSMTTQSCQDYCTGKGYRLSGTEYSTECFCGNTLENGATIGGSTACTMPCGGDTQQICGGPSALSVYNNTVLETPKEPTELPSFEEYKSLGCYTEGINGRALDGRATAASNMTIPLCVAYCRTSGFKFAGTEYSTECYCGNSIANNAAPATGCNMLCGGDKYTFCGGPSRLNIYGSNATSPSTTASTTTATTISSATLSTGSITTTASPTSTSTSPTSTPTLSPGWVSLGCANETDSRSLSGSSTAGAMTINKCLTFCLNNDFPLAGLEYGNECYCGTALHPDSKLGQSGCDMACTGNEPGTICGGVSRLSVYNYTLHTPTIIVPSVGTYDSLGCYTEGTTTRALSGYAFANNTLTVERCVTGCEDRGFSHAGVEYGTECYCGNALSSESKKVSDAQCNMPCGGNSRTYCGAGGRLVVYRNGTVTP